MDKVKAEKEARRESVQAFASRCTIPIIEHALVEGMSSVCGSGVLYRARGEHFLVTAAHVAQKYQEGRLELGIPAKKALAAPVDLLTLPEHVGDVAVFRLPVTYAETIQASGYWEFVDEDLEKDRPYRKDSEFILHGYPSKINPVTETHVGSNRLTVFTKHYSGPVDGVSSSATPQDWDLLLVWPQGRDKEYMRGMSGCGVWEVREPPPGELWTVKRIARPVAVDTGMVPGRWIRTTTWEHVRFLIDQATLGRDSQELERVALDFRAAILAALDSDRQRLPPSFHN